MLTVRWLGLGFVGALGVVACSSKTDEPPAPVAQGGTSGQGGDSSSGGRAGAGAGGSAAGGSGASGGSASGGDTSAGGTSGSGGASTTGGASGSGGASGAGGKASTGGSAGSPGGAGGAAGSPSGGRGGSGGSGGGLEGDYGFTYRVPGSHSFMCQDRPLNVPDADWLCTFSQGEEPAYVYVQATAVGVMCAAIAATGTYEVSVAQISVDGVVSDLADAAYDWGGGHHNDSVSFSYGGKTYKYYHSSFGFGFRQCQPMDCVDVYATGSTAPEVEGCGPDRALPEVCVPIDEQGGHAELVDEFMKCPGDSQ
jgi:hypothetical protein